MGRTDTSFCRLPRVAHVLCAASAALLLACGPEPSPASQHEDAHSEDGEASRGDFGDAAMERAPDAGFSADGEAPPAPTADDAATSASDAFAAAMTTDPDAGIVGGAAPRNALIAPELWLPVERFDDPFADRPDVPRCPMSAVMAEVLSGEPVFSVNTGECDYVTVSQPIERAVAAGETIRVRLWHFELSAPDPAEAHAALLVDGLAALDERIPIPQPGGLISRELRLTRAVPAGALVHFHLHNHGANSWSLVEVSAGP
jgi:hypothetical protein